MLPSTLADIGHVCLNGFYGDGRPVGMLVTVEFPDFTYMLFLATFAEYRGQGIGSKIIDSFYAENPDAFTIGAIEKPDESADNNAQRLSRKTFYERLGYSAHDFGVRFNGCDFLVIAKGDDADSREAVERCFNTMKEASDELAKAFKQ